MADGLSAGDVPLFVLDHHQLGLADIADGATLIIIIIIIIIIRRH